MVVGVVVVVIIVCHSNLTLVRIGLIKSYIFLFFVVVVNVVIVHPET